MADTRVGQDCPADRLDPDIVKSPNDKKTYRHFKLANGVTVLLIHDPAVAAGLATDATQTPGSAADASDMDDDSNGSEGSEGSGAEDESSGDDDESSGSSGEDEDEGEGVRKGKKGGSSGALATKKAAAAMAVGVGSFTDPAEMPGLAHYLEHMLFMGSDKYPQENEYDTFLNNHGGSSNAYTELEYTNYHFDVAPAHLEGALDRLAQFFVKPLFLAGSLEREVQAVDSEFKGVLQSDHSRLAQLMCHTCRPGHVYNKFSWGNVLSLWEKPRAAGLDVRQSIIDFYRRHYSAERMSFVVLGGQDLDTLQAWVQASFGDIPPGTAGPAASFEAQGRPFQGPPCLYLSPAVKEHHEVTVTFQLPCLRPNYPNKPEHYISHLVGHEGPGSLLSALKARGWALELCAGIDDDGYSFNTAAYLFTVNIVLTDAGLAAGPGGGLAPVGLLFKYLALLSSSEPQQWVYQELAAISDMKWRFLEEEDSCDFVTRLAATMGWVDPQHLLVADYLHDAWQPQRVKELLALMHPSSSNYRIDLLTKSFSSTQQQLTQLAAVQGGTMSDVHEPWFNMQAVRWQLPESVISSWSSSVTNGCVASVTSTGAAEQAGPAAAAAAAGGGDGDDGLAFPPPNPFIPTDFSLKGAAAAAAAWQIGAAAGDGGGGAAQGQQQQQQEISSLPPWVLSSVGGRPGHVDVLLSTPPDMILDTPGVRLWHKLAVRYGQPRMVTYWRLSSPLAASSARAAVLCALWLRLVEEAQAEEGYLADVAGLHWSSCPEGLSGLEVRMDGFSHKLGVLATRVFRALATPQLKAASFTAVREELMRRYRNALLKPYHAANALRLQLLSGGPAWSHDELAEALESVTGLEEVQIFAVDFLSCCHLESLIMGNVTAAEALALCRDLASIINTPTAAAAGQQAAGTADTADTAGDVGGDTGSGSSSSSRLVLDVSERPVEVCVQLPEGVEVLRVEPTRNPEEDNCCVEVYYQVGLSSTDLRLRVLTDLVEQVVSEALYDTLRTKQQLGYTVSSGARLTHGVTGFCVVVVSAAFDAATVEQRIEAFMLEFQQTRLQNMDAEEFARHKSSLVSNKLTSDTSMGQEADRAWEQVFSTRYEFVSREQEAAMLQDVTLQELQSFYVTYISPASMHRRKLCIHITPTGGQQQQQMGGGSSSTPAKAKHPQEHVQHEFGVLHPSGEHTQHTTQHTRQDVEVPPSGGAHAANGDLPAAAAADGSQESPSTRQNKRPRRQQHQQQGAGEPQASLSAVQAAPVQVISDLKGFKAAAGRYGAYVTVQPQLKPSDTE